MEEEEPNFPMLEPNLEEPSDNQFHFSDDEADNVPSEINTN